MSWVFDKRLNGVGSAPGIDRDSVESPNLEHRLAIRPRRWTYVSSLGVADDYRVLCRVADVGDGLFQGLQAIRSQCLIKGQIGLVGAGGAGRSIDYLPVELEHVLHWHGRRVGVQPNADQAAAVAGSPQDFFGECAHRYVFTPLPVKVSIVTITGAGAQVRGEGVPVILGDDLVQARFVRRVNRFLAVAELDGREEGVHVANSGRLRELFLPGARLWLKPAGNPGRKTSYDLELVEAGGALVSADARLPNALVAEAAEAGTLESIGPPSAITRECTFGESRFDLMLEYECGKRYVEVKSVTLVENGVGLFPDSPTSRGAKHLNTLAEAVLAGHRAAVVFVVQRADAAAFAANEPADPALAEALRRAVAAGVEAYAYNCLVTLNEVRLAHRLPIVPFESIPSEEEQRL